MTFRRKKLIVGNWKMNKNRVEARKLIEEIKPLVQSLASGVVLCVPFTDLETACELTNSTNIKIGAQNCHFKDSGAYTGEISVNMLKELSVDYVILGHSERRQYFAETDETVNLRLKAAIGGGLTAIVCVGEQLSDRERSLTKQVILNQVVGALKGISKDEMEKVIVAYEPVWAIGTGKTATSSQAEEVCGLIRDIVKDIFEEEVSNRLQILYGGSMNAENCKDLLEKQNIDGGLIGGASLKAADFSQIVKAADSVQKM